MIYKTIVRCMICRRLHFCRVDNVAAYKVYACLFMSRPSGSILLPGNRDAMPDLLNPETRSAFWYPASLL